MKQLEIHPVLAGLSRLDDAQRLPELPNFGIFYLSIPSAAALIVDDLKRSGRTTFGVEENSDEDSKKREKRLASRVAELTANLEARLLASVESGRLRCCTQSRTLEDFLQGSDRQYLPDYTHIQYSDLLAWLADAGYVDPNSQYESPAFSDYERRELDLLENLQSDLKLRRDQRGRRIDSYMRVLVPPASDKDAELRLKERLAEVLEQVQDLEQKNQALKESIGQVPEAPVNVNTKHSYLKMIGMLCAMCKYDLAKRETTGIFERATKHSALALDNTTIRKIFGEVIEEKNRRAKI